MVMQQRAGAAQSARTSSRDHIRRQALAELACLILLVEAIMWVVPLLPASRAAYAGLSLLIMVLLLTCLFRDRPRLGAIGVRVDNFFQVLKRIALPLGLFVLLVVATGFAAGTLRFKAKFYSMLIFVPYWAFIQQYMLLAFSHSRFRILLGEGRPSILATTVLFSLLHLPNPVLTVACAAGGYIWTYEYERSPNLFANSITHAVASAFLANSLPGWLLKNMVVGLNYFYR